MGDRDALDRRAQAREGLIRDDGSQSGGNTAVIVAFVGDYNPTGLFYRSEQSVAIQWL
jgi:hypothetical protein